MRSNRVKNTSRLKHRRALLAAALSYAKRGWMVLPLDGKEPLISGGYTAATSDRKQIRAWWRKWPDANVGIACNCDTGPIVLDCDEPKPGELSATKLIHRWKFGATMEARTGGGGKHYYFAPSDEASDLTRLIRPLVRGQRKYALDVLGSGGYVVAPPSVHPDSGRKYRWVESSISTCTSFPRAVAKALRQARRKRDRRTPIAETLPSIIHEGERDTWLTSLAGTLRRRGMTHAEIFDVLFSMNESRCRPRLSTGQVEKIARSIAKKPSVEDVYHELNLQYALVVAGPQQTASAILWQPHPLAPSTAAESAEYGLMTVRAFHDRLATQSVGVTLPTGRTEQIPVSHGWFKWPGRRQYDRIVFKPGQTELPANEFNTWRGWPLRSSKRGSCALFLDHLRRVVCSAREAHYEWLIDWLADIIQNPQRPPDRGAAVALRGLQGAGKSIVGDVMGRLLGKHRVKANSLDQLFAKHNAHLEHCLLLQVEEAFWAGERGVVGRLKDLVTGRTIQIEPKFVNAYTVDNYLRLLLTSNESWVWPADLDDRRAVVFDVKPSHRGDRPYFQRLFAELEDGGYARLMYEFERRTIDEARLTSELPRTKALVEQVLHTQGQQPEEAWLRDFLRRGRVPEGSHVDAEGYAHTMTAHLYEDYRASLRKQDREKTKIEFGAFLSKHLPKPRGMRPQIPKRSDGVQGQRRILEPLAVCRRRYAARGRAAPRQWAEAEHEQRWRLER